jgi:hypothetical protein
MALWYLAKVEKNVDCPRVPQRIAVVFGWVKFPDVEAVLSTSPMGFFKGPFWGTKPAKPLQEIERSTKLN